ncbi:UDP-glucose 4-epimerase GalE [Phytohabitans rumicis]|nr:UDP-glucose 4-epimerase GalE [Phytohabitans rumicis]
MKVLIAGGAGFIGSTVASACLDEAGASTGQPITPIVLDNLSAGRTEFVRGRIFYEGDIADARLVDKIFAEHPEIEAVVHCAALIVVPHSVAQPLLYYRENVAKSVAFLDSVIENGCGRVLFSSSASVYQAGSDLAVDETSPIAPTSPYAHGKAMVEQILQDCVRAYPVRVIALRYFNPIGADPKLRTGPQSAESSHVLGRMVAAARGGEPFAVTGVDWPTRDGSGVRDYVHVWDLARAHVQALRRFDDVVPPAGPNRYAAINLGTGRGTTVRELLGAFEAVIGRSIGAREVPRRFGDCAGGFNDSVRSGELLGWRPTLSLTEAIRHELQWSAVRDGHQLIPQ